MVFKNLYQLIQVPNFSTQVEVKAAFWQLAKLYHPDTSEGDHYERFLEIRNAYELLSDPKKKAEYDALLVAHLKPTLPTKSYKIRADKIWIAKYKADQLKKNKVKPVGQSETKTENNHHWVMLTISIVLAILLLLLIIQ